MSAKIYRPAKTAMQSGKAKTHLWVLEFDQSAPRVIDPLMGYTGSGDMQQQVKLTFETREAAEAYAKANGIAYRVMEPKESHAQGRVLFRQFPLFSHPALDTLNKAGAFSRRRPVAARDTIRGAGHRSLPRQRSLSSAG